MYIGVTADLIRRVYEHKNHEKEGSFTDHYNCEFCVYYEKYNDIKQAIDRETQLKNWNRYKKIELINSKNPDWIELVKDTEIINIEDLIDRR